MRNDEFLSPEELADFLSIPIRTVYSWRNRRTGPRGYRIGRHVRYRKSEVLEWLAEQRDERVGAVG